MTMKHTTCTAKNAAMTKIASALLINPKKTKFVDLIQHQQIAQMIDLILTVGISLVLMK